MGPGPDLFRRPPADQGNNTAGGSPGDGTAILAGLKAAGWPDAALFIAAFEIKERIPRMIFEVDTPGIISPNTIRFTYHNVPRPIFPLDDFEWAGPEGE